MREAIHMIGRQSDLGMDEPKGSLRVGQLRGRGVWVYLAAKRVHQSTTKHCRRRYSDKRID